MVDRTESGENRRAADLTGGALPAHARTVPWILYLACAVVALGVYFRFAGLEHKLYTNDEATSSLRASGYTLADYGAVFDGKTRTAKELAVYQAAGPQTSAADALRSLAYEDPQHAPLYYLVLRQWTSVFGDSLAARRMPSAVFGTLALLAVFWLGTELFTSVAAGAVAAMLVAVSPFQVIYAQQAREYSLWMLLVAVSSALLLRALRRNEATDWALYAISIGLALYTDVLFLSSIAGYALYVVLSQRPLWSRVALAFTVATFVPIVAYLPWLLALYRGANLVTNNFYLGAPLGLKLFALKWLFNTGAVFFDGEYGHVKLAFLLLPLLGIIAWGIVSLVRRAPRASVLFVLTLALVPLAGLVAPDLLHHESRSTAARYLVPVWLALELCLSFLFANAFVGPGAQTRTRRAAGAALAFVLLLGAASNVADAGQEITWADASARPLGPIARHINEAAHPLVLFVDDPGQWDFSVASLTSIVDPNVRFKLLHGAALDRTATALRRDTAGERSLLLLDPTPRVQAAVAQAIPGNWRRIYVDEGGGDAALRGYRKQASASRASAGFVDSRASLWLREAGVR